MATDVAAVVAVVVIVVRCFPRHKALGDYCCCGCYFRIISVSPSKSVISYKKQRGILLLLLPAAVPVVYRALVVRGRDGAAAPDARDRGSVPEPATPARPG